MCVTVPGQWDAECLKNKKLRFMTELLAFM